MNRQVVVILRRPEEIGQGIATARLLTEDGARPQVVFLCPGCVSRSACRKGAMPAGELDPRCLTDQREACAPPGFWPADEGRIARLIRESDVAVPI